MVRALFFAAALSLPMTAIAQSPPATPPSTPPAAARSGDTITAADVAGKDFADQDHAGVAEQAESG